MASEHEITQILVMLAAAYPRYNLTKETVMVYVRLLSDLPAADLQAAALQCAVSRDFFPSVHELRAAVNEINEHAAGIPSAYEAWEETSKALPPYSAAVELEDGTCAIEPVVHTWSHPVVEATARLLGWPSSFPGDVPGVDRAHFFKAYEDALSRARAGKLQLPEVAAYTEQLRSGATEVTDLLKLGTGRNK